MRSISGLQNVRSRLQGFANVLTDREWLILFFCALVAAKIVWVSSADGPIVFGDEYIFKSLARSFFTLNGYVVNGKTSIGFPPIYPLVLAPSFLFGDNWYRWMLVINAVISSTLIFPVAWIARQFLSRTQGWACVWLAGLIPFHVVYPRLLMSENLFLTLFLSSVGFVMTDLNRYTRRTALLVGALWGITYLTRYIFLPLIPVLAVLWWLQPVIAGNQRLMANARHKLNLVGWTALGVGVLVIPWYFLSRPPAVVTETASAPVVMGIGEQWVARTVTTWNGSLITWLVLYLAYLVLMSGPFLPILTLLPLTLRRMSPGARFFALVCAGVTGTLLLVSVNYMATVALNWPDGVMEGRYVMPALPLLPVLAFVVLQPAGQLFARVKRAWLLVDLGIAGVLASIGYYLLVLRGLWPLAPWFSSLPWVAPDSTAFNEMKLGQLDVGFFGFGLVLMATGFAWVAWRPRQWPWILVLAATVFYAADCAYTGGQLAVAQEQSRAGRVLADLTTNPSEPHPVSIVLDAGVPIAPDTLPSSISFWNVPIDSLVVHTAIELQDQSAQDPGFTVTQTEYPNPLRHFTIEGKTYGVYRSPITLSGLPLVIQRFGPTETVAGQGFNIQPNGDSALWMMADNLSPGVILVFGAEELPTVAGESNVVTAAIPAKLLAKPGVIQVWLRDPITRRTSNVVQFVIKDH